MKTTLEWIDEAKTRLNMTDYALSKRLGISTSVMSNYRTGRHVISENHAILLGEAMGVDPLPIVAAAAYERSKADHIKAFWARHAELASVAVGAFLVGTLLTAPADAQATTAKGHQTGPNAVYYVNRRQWKRTRKDRRERWSRNITGLYPGFFSSSHLAAHSHD